MNYLHFDTAQREDLTTDPFSCEMKIASPLRNVKKIYLKSLEMPVGFFNIRETQYFEYVSSHINYTNINPKTLGVYAYNPIFENNYKALFAHRAHSVFVRRALQVEATPACCSALLRVRANLLSGFESQTWLAALALTVCFIFISKEITSTTDFYSHLPSLACTVACTRPTVAHGVLRTRRAFMAPLSPCHVMFVSYVRYTF